MMAMRLDPTELTLATIRYLLPIEERLFLMGIRTPGNDGWNAPQYLGEVFRRQLLWGPHAQVVRRREVARQQEAFRLETLHYFFRTGDPQQDADVERRLRRLRGYDD